MQDRLDFFRELEPPDLPVLAVEFDQPDTVAPLREKIYRMLNVIRIYTKVPGKPADYSSPFTLPVGSTVEALAEKIHKDVADKLKFAKVWGSGLHDGQSVGRDHVLADKDVIELHTG